MRVPSLAVSAWFITTVVAKFKYIGVNEAGPEFGEKKIPGVKDKDYVWPKSDAIDPFIKRGMNTFRINFMMERVIPNRMIGSLDRQYLQDLKSSVDYITGKGAYAMLNPHNYGRYNGKIIEDTSAFEAFWKTLATPFKDNAKVIFDTNNEYHDMNQDLVVRLNQAAINGIRASGAKQEINVEGNYWSGAWSWTNTSNNGGTNGATMGRLTDPLNKIVYQMHQYLDSDGSGTHEECVSSRVGEERLRAATSWLKQNKKVGIIGEFAAGNGTGCQEAIAGMLKYMQQNSDVWQGWLWWSAGPWWADYKYNMEPPTGRAWSQYLDLIMKYA